MKFTRVGSSGSGSSQTPLDHNELMMMDRAFLRTYKIARCSIQKAWEFEKDQRDRLEMLWYYVISFQNTLLLEFHAEQSYYIDWDEISATDTDLNSVIADSYKHLQRAFAPYLKEYDAIYPPVADISDDTKQHTLRQLRELFPAQQ